MNKNQTKINSLLLHINLKIDATLNSILHAPAVSNLESSWRGLFYLISLTQSNQVKIKFLNTSLDLINQDFKSNHDFEKTQLFNKIYNEEYDRPGGEPYGLIIADYYIDHGVKQLPLLHFLSKIAAAAFAPVAIAVECQTVGLHDWQEVTKHSNLNLAINERLGLGWERLRQSEDAQFVSLIINKCRPRPPYSFYTHTTYRDFVKEDTSKIGWQNPVYELAATAINAYSQQGWFAFMDHPRHFPATATTASVSIWDRSLPQTAENFSIYAQDTLAAAGFITLTNEPHSEHYAFHSLTTLYKPNSHANTTAKLHYLLCACRFAHYVKIMLRDKIGRFTSTQSIQAYLTQWLSKYTANNSEINTASKIKYPLKEAQVKVNLQPGELNKYICSLYLRLHFQSETLSPLLYLTTYFNKS